MATQHRITAVEVTPVMYDGEQMLCVEAEKAEAFGVYLRREEGGNELARWVTDFADREDAIDCGLRLASILGVPFKS